MKLITLFLLVWCMTACEDELNVLPENSLTLNNALQTPKNFEAAIRGVEQSLREMGIYNNPVIQEMKGYYADDVQEGRAEWLYLFNDYLNSALIPSYNSENWTLEYEGIAKANAILNQVDDAGLSKDRHDLYKGQVLFFKALFYYRLIQRFGDCILLKEDVIDAPTPKTPWDEVAEYAIGLVREAARLLPEFNQLTDWKGSAYTNKATPGKGAANALLAYLCAWKAGCKYFAANPNYDEKLLWEEAEQACTEIIKSGTYTLEPNPEAVCTRGLVENSPESIYETVNRGFELEMSMFDDFTFVTLLAYNVRAFRGYPLNPSTAVGSIGNNPINIRVTTVDQWYKEGDARKNSYFYKPDELAEQTHGYAWGYKFRELAFSKRNGLLCGLNQNKVWWRLADIYLLRAECRTRLGDKEGAIADLNEIRNRAGAKRYNASEDNGDLRYTVFLERQKELLMEGHRYFDVIRNGYVNTELHGNFRTLTVQDMKDGALFMCIGNDAFSNNPLMRQNSYWFMRM